MPSSTGHHSRGAGSPRVHPRGVATGRGAATQRHVVQPLRGTAGALVRAAVWVDLEGAVLSDRSLTRRPHATGFPSRAAVVDAWSRMSRASKGMGWRQGHGGPLVGLHKMTASDAAGLATLKRPVLCGMDVTCIVKSDSFFGGGSEPPGHLSLFLGAAGTLLSAGLFLIENSPGCAAPGCVQEAGPRWPRRGPSLLPAELWPLPWARAGSRGT